MRVDRIFGDSESNSFTCYEEEFTEAARAARTSAGRGMEVENYPQWIVSRGLWSYLGSDRALEEKAKDIAGGISALTTYFTLK